MRYQTTCPISLKGDRIEAGVEIELSPEEAANFGPDLAPVEAAPAEEAKPEAPKPIEEMSLDELKARAKELGLKATGSKADLAERIALKLQGGEA
jgi:hypothetical protein